MKTVTAFNSRNCIINSYFSVRRELLLIPKVLVTLIKMHVTEQYKYHKEWHGNSFIDEQKKKKRSV